MMIKFYILIISSCMSIIAQSSNSEITVCACVVPSPLHLEQCILAIRCSRIETSASYSDDLLPSENWQTDRRHIMSWRMSTVSRQTWITSGWGWWWWCDTCCHPHVVRQWRWMCWWPHLPRDDPVKDAAERFHDNGSRLQLRRRTVWDGSKYSEYSDLSSRVVNQVYEALKHMNVNVCTVQF